MKLQAVWVGNRSEGLTPKTSQINVLGANRGLEGLIPVATMRVQMLRQHARGGPAAALQLLIRVIPYELSAWETHLKVFS